MEITALAYNIVRLAPSLGSAEQKPHESSGAIDKIRSVGPVVAAVVLVNVTVVVALAAVGKIGLDSPTNRLVPSS